MSLKVKIRKQIILVTERVTITDVSPRDGLQNEAGVVPASEKVRLIGAVAAAGVDEIEATSFVSAKWVPQLGDAGEVLATLREAGWFGRKSAEGAGDGCGEPPLLTGEGRGEGSDVRRFHQRPPGATEKARALRREMTEPERRLWRRLRVDQLARVRFRRQHPIGPYVADLYCPSHRLVIEIDGRSHEILDRRARDAARDAWMAANGYRVLRFSNDQVMRELDGVVRVVWGIVGEEPLGYVRGERGGGVPLPPAPSPTGRGGEAESLSPGPSPRGRGGEAESLSPGPSPRGRGEWEAPLLSVLVPNETGFERALGFHSAEFPLKIAVFTAASETFNKKNTNASIAESIERFRAFVPRAIGMGMRVRLYVSCAIACPYEGAIEPTAVRRVCDELLEMVDPDAFDNGEVEIDLGDTIGAGTPESVRALIGVFDEIERMSLVLHLHDTHGRAAECVRAALDMGVRSFDGSVAGLGGCPYAGTREKPAPGNISTETLVRTVHGAGFVTGVDEDALAAAGAIAREIVGRARASGV